MNTYPNFQGGVFVATSPSTAGRTYHPGGMMVVIGDGSVRNARSNVYAIWLTTGLHGLSHSGAIQFLDGEIVRDSSDRRILADALLRGLGLSADGATGAGMLLPAVQAIREAVKQVSPRARLSIAGASQFVSGDPVSDPNDRTVLAGQECLVFFGGGVP